MTHRRLAKTFIPVTILLLGFFFSNTSQAQDGKVVFQANCASCHKMDQKLTGPALLGVADRWGGNRAKIHDWIKHPAIHAQTNPYAASLIKEYGTIMTPFDGVLSDKEIEAVIDYVIKWTPPVVGPTGDPNGAKGAESDNSLLFGLLTLILAVVALTLLQVNSNLKKLSDDKSGIPAAEPIAFWKNKAYIAMVIVVFFVIGGYFVTKAAQGLGRNKDYQPEQPIFYSHKVHAGVNQINCLYCHGGAEQGKHANIPSVNVCMNCHKAITEYKGEKLFNAEGKEVDGTAEIKKLHDYAGFNAAKPNDWDASKARPIEWTKIHNLPDHVYFNHSQHTKAGKVQCQTCHGDIPSMGEVKQFADLSMGWCINCHRETKVQFKENGFYSIYQKFHDQIEKDVKADSLKLVEQGFKNIKPMDRSKYLDKITVEKIGGTECQKCHY
jgi:cytochrome c551/c552